MKDPRLTEGRRIHPLVEPVETAAATTPHR
jgi:hypothetical protein